MPPRYMCFAQHLVQAPTGAAQVRNSHCTASACHVSILVQHTPYTAFHHTGTVKPHHVVTPQGVALGYSHLGMLAAARWLLGQTKSCLIQALEEHPGFQLRIVGTYIE